MPSPGSASSTSTTACGTEGGSCRKAGVADASSLQIANGWDDIDWQQGYGFLLWMSQHGYRGDGAFGQYMVVLPEHDAVVAVFSCIERMQVILDAMWEHLLPAMEAGALAPSPADDELVQRMAHLTLPTAAERAGGDDLGDVPAMAFTRRPGRDRIPR